MSALLLARLLSAAPADAADLIDYISGMPVSGPKFDWSGPYVGVNIGGAITTNGYADGQGTPQYMAHTPNTFIWSLPAGGQNIAGGVQAGYNYQYGNFVVGVEGDVDFTHVGGTGSFTGSQPLGGTILTTTASDKLEYLAAGLFKLGYAGLNRWLLYAEGGPAFGEVDRFANIVGVTNPAYYWGVTSNTLDWGFAVGGGAEYALTDHITLRANYLYYDLFSKTIATAPNAAVLAQPAFNGVALVEKSMAAGSLITFGADYKF